jgi:hypothetical protein
VGEDRALLPRPLPQGQGRLPLEGPPAARQRRPLAPAQRRPWPDTPERYGKWKTVYDRSNRWRKDDTSAQILDALLLQLDRAGFNPAIRSFQFTLSQYTSRLLSRCWNCSLGSGTQLKVLEALVYAKAVVATSIAIEGLDLRPGLDLEIADAPGPFAEARLRLLADGAARRRLGQTGRARVLERYHWDVIGQAVTQTLAGWEMDFRGAMLPS